MSTRNVKCLSDFQKETIYSKWKGNFTKSYLAEEFDVSPRTIGRVITEMVEKELDKAEEVDQTPCEKLGYKVGDVFEVSQKAITFSGGSTVELYRDDGSDNPLFLLIDGSCLWQGCDGDDGAFLSLEFVTPINSPYVDEEKSTPVPKTSFNVGDVVRISSTGETYDAYEQVAIALDLKNWVKGGSPSTDSLFKITDITVHPVTNIYLYIIQDEQENQFISGDKYFSLSTEEYKISKSQYTLVPGSIVVIQHSGEVYTVDASHDLFDKIVKKCTTGHFQEAVNLSEPAKAMTEFTKGDVTVCDGQVMYMGEVVNDGLGEAILRLMSDGDDGFKKLVSFLDKVKKNPSYKSRMELFGFIKAADIEITDSGDLICWKRIKEDWTDCHTGTIDNSVGAIVEMDRKDVNDNSNETCSDGLHCCAKSYLNHFRGARVVKVLVNPEDVVSIPTDYNHAKMRTCKYVVIEEVNKADL